MNYNELYKQRILELLKLCTDVETENEMLLKQIEEQSVKIKETEQEISILKYSHIYTAPVYVPYSGYPFDQEYTDETKMKVVPCYSNMISISNM